MKRVISIFLVVAVVSSFCIVANAAGGKESGKLGTQTIYDHTYAAKKAIAVERIMEIREKYLENNGVISNEERVELRRLINEFYPNAQVEDYLPPMNSTTRSNPGDYQSLNLNLPGRLQETGYYCAPASGYAVLSGRGISVTQNELAEKMNTTTDGTGFYEVNDALNEYNGVNGNRFHYAELVGYQLSGESMTATEWAIQFSNAAISTLLGEYGVIYNVHQVAGSSNYLTGYANSSGVAAGTVWHFVAGEGFDSSDPSNRICYYYDTNNKSGLGTHHMEISFRVMAVLCNDRGLIY